MLWSPEFEKSVGKCAKGLWEPAADVKRSDRVQPAVNHESPLDSRVWLA